MANQAHAPDAQQLRAAGADVPLDALSDAEAAGAIVRWLKEKIHQ